MRPSIQRARVVADLRARIERGEDGHRPGDLLPTHAELAKKYEVSARTAGNAVGELIAEGLAESDGRAGTRIVGKVSRLFLVADSNLEQLRLVDGLDAAQQEAERLGGVMAELRVTKDYRRGDGGEGAGPAARGA